MSDAQMEPEWLRYLRMARPDLFHEFVEQERRAYAERDKLAERVRVLEEALDAALLYRLAHETGAKIGAQDKTKADADIDKALIARAATEEEK